MVYERINEILKEKNISKKDFAKRLINLDAELKSTDNAPSLSTIYNYLNGNREIKADMIPFIAVALDVSEQELFFQNEKDIEKFYRKMLLNDNATSIFSKSISSRILKLISLASYAPEPLLDRIIVTLETNKNNIIKSIKNFGDLDKF